MRGEGRTDREELSALAAALRAHAEWQMATGATGLPRDVSSPARSSPSRAPTSTGTATTTGTTTANTTRTATASTTTAASASAPTPQAAGAAGPATAQGALFAPPAPVVAAVTADPEARARRLAVLADEVRGCKKCGLHAKRTQTVFARGSARAEVCFVGEGPGADEDAQGFPFVGRAGQLLDRMIAAMGYARDDVYVCNIVKCRPPDNRKPEPGEMEACAPYVHEQIALVGPKVIVALGATAVEGLLGLREGITRMRGNWKLYRGTLPVMPTFHPAYLLRNPAAKRDVWIDLQAVLRQLGRPLPGKAGA